MAGDYTAIAFFSANSCAFLIKDSNAGESYSIQNLSRQLKFWVFTHLSEVKIVKTIGFGVD